MPTPATVQVRYNVGSFTVWPYQVVHMADQVTVSWSTTNITNVKVELVGSDGQKVLVTNNVQGTWPLKRGRAVKYAQSQALDNGNGVVDDTGEDAYPVGPLPPRGSEGLSSTFAVEPERSFAYGLLPTGTAEYLLYTIDIVDKTASVQIDYPTFLFPGETPEIVVENSRVQCALWPKVGDRRGPGVRFGQWISYDPLIGYINPPIVGGLGGKMSVMDWLVLRRLVFDRNSYNGGTPDLTTELTQLYDTFEGQSPGQAYKNSIVWFLPKRTDNKIRAALVNTVSEIPPLACWPSRDRDADWNATGDHVMKVWSWHELPRHYISPGTVPLEVYDNSPRALWTTSDSAPAGWAISSHAHTLDNYEHADFDLSNSVRDFAKISPWHGLFGVDWIAMEESSGDSPSYDVANQLTHVRTHIQGGTVRFAWDDNKFQRAFASADTGITAQSACIRIRKRSKNMLLILWVEAGGSIVRYTSSDHGATWTMSTTIATGTKPTAFITQDGTEYVYWTDGTAIKGQIRDASGNIVEAAFTAVSGIDSGTGSAAHWSNLSGGGLRVVLWVTISGALTRFESVDSGKTFT